MAETFSHDGERVRADSFSEAAHKFAKRIAGRRYEVGYVTLDAGSSDGRSEIWRVQLYGRDAHGRTLGPERLMTIYR